MAGLDTAGRKIAGLLGYNPGPGIYSRLERAIQEMPANVRVQELPGLLKRYKEGVPGWELKAADLDSIIAGRDVVPQEELLAAVRERSPVFTHGEMLLQGRMEPRPLVRPAGDVMGVPGSQLTGMRPLGRGVAVGDPKYSDYGQGGDSYGELLLIQPGADGQAFGSHWGALPGGTLRTRAADSAVAHARYDTHGDALRINELQSDLGIYNRRRRETSRMPPAPFKSAGETDSEYAERLQSLGHEVEWNGGGYEPVNAPLTFPLEDAWADILIKRLALEAARGGHRAIEVASPRSIADKVGGNIDNYEHFYGKVVPGAIERLGRKMGGVSPVDVSKSHIASMEDAERQLAAETREYRRQAGLTHPDSQLAYQRLVEAMEDGNDPEWISEQADYLLGRLMGPEKYSGDSAGMLMPELMSLAGRQAQAQAASRHAFRALNRADIEAGKQPVRRYIMSDEMRRRLIEQGVGASLLGGLMPADTEQ